MEALTKLANYAAAHAGASLDLTQQEAELVLAEIEQLRTLVRRAHSMLSIREAVQPTEKGKAWLAEAGDALP